MGVVVAAVNDDDEESEREREESRAWGDGGSDRSHVDGPDL